MILDDVKRPMPHSYLDTDWWLDSSGSTMLATNTIDAHGCYYDEHGVYRPAMMDHKGELFVPGPEIIRFANEDPYDPNWMPAGTPILAQTEHWARLRLKQMIAQSRRERGLPPL